MWSIIGILAIGMVMMFIEVPSLLKKKQKRDLWFFSILLLMGVALNILQNLEVTIPNPAEGITAAFHPYSEAISELFK